MDNIDIIENFVGDFPGNEKRKKRIRAEDKLALKLAHREAKRLIRECAPSLCQLKGDCLWK